jgi:hypothetical protein
MKKIIVVVGSTQYKEKIDQHALELWKNGYDVRIPAFDDHKELDELEVCEYNRTLIEKAEEVHIIWDQRSVGMIFDFGMAFALRKKIKIVYLEPKTLAGAMRKYEKKGKTKGT